MTNASTSEAEWSGYTHEIEVALRQRDLDNQGHVYHGEFLTILDEGRSRWLASFLDLARYTIVIARMEIDYRSELTWGLAPVTTCFAVERIGSSSMTLREGIITHEGLQVASASTVIVKRSLENGASTQWNELEREACQL